MFEVGEARDAVTALVAAVSDAPQGVPLQDWVGLVGDCQALTNQLCAAQTTALARLAAVEEVPAEDGTIVQQDLGIGHQRMDAPGLVSDLLGLTDAGAGSRVEHAVRSVSHIPELVDAMRTGVLDAYRAAVVSEELADAPAEVCAAVMAQVSPHLGAETAGLLRRRVRRVLAQVAPDLLKVKADRARKDRALRRWTTHPGVDEWSGTFPVEQARPAWAVIDKLAKHLVADGVSTNLDQARADALMQLIHGQASGTYLLQIAISADDLAAHPTPEGEDDELVDVTGLGVPGITHVSRAWLDSLPGAPFTTHTRTTSGTQPPSTEPTCVPAPVNRSPGTDRPVAVATELVVCDPVTGGLLGRIDRTGTPLEQHDRTDDGAEAASGRNHQRRRARRRQQPRARGGDVHPGYVPPAWMATLVRARDGGCRFPGCTTTLRFCDLDHVIPWPAGTTAADNLIALCRRHHRIKQTHGWSVRLDSDGTTTWTDPTGRTRTTHPQDLRGPELPAVARVPVDPDEVVTDHPIATGLTGNWSDLEEELELALAVVEHQNAEADRKAARCRSRRDDYRVHDPNQVDDQPPSRTGSRQFPRVELIPPPRHWTLSPDLVDLLLAQHRERRQEQHRGLRPGPDDPPPF
jgi:hypothetical protein